MKRWLVLSAALVAGVAIAVPITLAASGGSATQFTVWPKNSARFANMDWNCDYQPALPSHGLPRALICRRESTERGVMVSVTGNAVRVFRCPSSTSCKVIVVAQRTP